MAASPNCSQIDSGPGELVEISSQGIQIAKDCSSPGDPAGKKRERRAEYLHGRDENKKRRALQDLHGKDEDYDLLEDPTVLQEDLQELSKETGCPVRVAVGSPGLLHRIPLNERLVAVDTWDLSAVPKKANVTQVEMGSQEDDLSSVYNPDSEGENHPWVAPDSPSTEQKKIENTRKEYMTRASHALKYYHTSHPGECYNPEHVNLKHVIFMMDTIGYYIHMNFTARNVKDGAEKIFFAELCLPYDDHTNEWVVTACDIVSPESLGGLRHVWRPNGIRFTGDTKDMKNCYACDDFVKHIDGSMYEAGHRGHCAYEVTDISVE